MIRPVDTESSTAAGVPLLPVAPPAPPSWPPAPLTPPYALRARSTASKTVSVVPVSWAFSPGAIPDNAATITAVITPPHRPAPARPKYMKRIVFTPVSK